MEDMIKKRVGGEALTKRKNIKKRIKNMEYRNKV
jgi:hypothetical protein